MKTVFEILVDVSGSMGTFDSGKYLLPDKSTRISLAKRVLLQEVATTIDFADKVIIRTFRANQDILNKVFTPVVESRYEGEFNLELIAKAIAGIGDDTESGGTPISAAVTISITHFRKPEFQGYEKVIILLTDGEENCGGDYKLVIEEASALYGIKCKIHLIGIALDSQAKAKAVELARTTGGSFHHLSDGKYTSNEVRRALIPLRTTIIDHSLKSLSENQNFQTEILNKYERLISRLFETKLEGHVSQLEIQFLSLKEKMDLVNSILNESRETDKRRLDLIDKSISDIRNSIFTEIGIRLEQSKIANSENSTSITELKDLFEKRTSQIYSMVSEMDEAHKGNLGKSNESLQYLKDILLLQQGINQKIDRVNMNLKCQTIISLVLSVAVVAVILYYMTSGILRV